MGPHIHLGPCHDLGSLWLFLSTSEQIARDPSFLLLISPILVNFVSLIF